MPAHGSFFQLPKIPSHGVNEALIWIVLLPPAGCRHLLRRFPLKNRKTTEPEPKNTWQRTILAQIICHYVHFGLCSLDQAWRENIPGSFPVCSSPEGNSQADHSLSGCSKPIIWEWKGAERGFFFLDDAFLRSWTGSVKTSSSLGSWMKTTGPLLDLFGGSTKAFFRSGEEWENLLVAYNTIFTVLI